MLRESDHYGITREYKNHNITIRLDKDGLQEFEKDELLILSDLLFWIDCDFIGETYCLNNWETGHTIYNSYSDKVYIFPWRCLEELKQGKTIRLYALAPDDTDREIIEREFTS